MKRLRILPKALSVKNRLKNLLRNHPLKKIKVEKSLRNAILFPVLLVAAVLIFTCAIFGLYPFGDGSLCWCDMRQQGLPLLMMLRNALRNGDSLSYMPGLCGGADFSGVAAFFLMNPGSLLAVLWKAESLPDLLNLLVFGKLLLCAGCAGWFFARRFPQNGVGFSTAFSVAYALCGYGLLYYQNLMWLDVMALFPLFLLACYALLERGRPIPYIAMMAVIMIACFYIGFMVALFALLFFGVHLWLCRENRIRTAVQFLLGSFAAALLSAPVWLPAFAQVVRSARTSQLSTSLSSCGWGTPFPTSLPLLLCSAGLPLLLIVTAMFFPRRTRKTDALAAVCGLLLIPMFLEPVNRMWHMGSYMCFPCRFAFMPIFLLLTLVAHLWAHSPAPLCRCRKARIVATVIGAAAVVGAGVSLVFVFVRRSEEAANYVRTLWGNADSLKVHLLVFAIVALVAAVWTVGFRAGFLKKSVAAVLLCALIVCESAFYASLYIGKVTDYWKLDSLSSLTDLSGRMLSDDFTRVKTSSDVLDSNMVGAIGYPSIGGYTSLVTEDTLFTAKKLGYTANWMDVGTNGGTVFSDALLSVSASIDLSNHAASGNPILHENGVYRLEQMPFTLPLGLLTDEATATALSTLPIDNRLHAQELIAQLLFNETNLFTRHPYTFTQNCEFEKRTDGASYRPTGSDPVIVYSIAVSDKQALYFDCYDGASTKVNEPIFGSFSVEVNGQTVCNSYPNSHESGFLHLGTFQNETVIVRLTPLRSGSCSSFEVFGLHYNAMRRLVENADTAPLAYDGHGFEGTFIADQNDCLVVTVPYIDGLYAVVDGHRRHVEKTLDNFVRVPLQSGESAVRLVYSPPGRVVGWLLFALGAAALTLAFVFRKKIDAFLKAHRRLMNVGKNVAFIASLTASALCAAAVYVFPLVYKLLIS